MLVVPILETVRTVKQVPLMCRVEGAELFFFGPADFSSTAGARGQWEGPGVAEQILQMKDTLRRAGKHCGLIATSHDNLIERQQQGSQPAGAQGLRHQLVAAARLVDRDGPERLDLGAVAGLEAEAGRGRLPHHAVDEGVRALLHGEVEVAAVGALEARELALDPHRRERRNGREA